MRELIIQASSGFSAYVMENHMLVLAIATIIYIFLSDYKKSKRIILFLASCSVMAFLIWFPFTSAVLMKYQTSLQSYESLWSLVPIAGLIALGGICMIQNEFLSNKRKNQPVMMFAGICVCILLVVMLGNMGAIHTMSIDQAGEMKERKQVIALLRGENLINPADSMGKVWAPQEILEVARQEDGEIILLYGRDLWDTRIASYAYDTYGASCIKLYDFMDEINNNALIYKSEDEELRERSLRNRGTEDCKMLVTALENGSGIWIFPEEARERITYALQALWEQYGCTMQEVASLNGYIVYKLVR